MPTEEQHEEEEQEAANPQKPFVYSRSLMLSLWSKERTYDVPAELASIMTDPEAGVVSTQPRPPVALQPYDAEEDKLYSGGGSLNSEVSMGDRNAVDHRYTRGTPNGRGSEHPRSTGRASRSERGSLSIQGGVLSGLGNGQTSQGQEISPPYGRRHRPEQSIGTALEENGTPTRYLNKKVSNLALGDPPREAPAVDSYKPPAHRADEANSWRRADIPSDRKVFPFVLYFACMLIFSRLMGYINLI